MLNSPCPNHQKLLANFSCDIDTITPQNNVVKINQAFFKQQTLQNIGHYFLKRNWSILETKWESIPLLRITSDNKCTFMFGARIHWQLLISLHHIEFRNKKVGLWIQMISQISSKIIVGNDSGTHFAFGRFLNHDHRWTPGKVLGSINPWHNKSSISSSSTF